MSAAVEDNIRVAPPRTLAGGLVATIVVTGVMYFGASMMLGAPMDIAGELGAMLATSPMMGKGIFMGAMPPAVASLMGHLACGVVLGLIVTVPARQ